MFTILLALKCCTILSEDQRSILHFESFKESDCWKIRRAQEKISGTAKNIKNQAWAKKNVDTALSCLSSEDFY